MEAFKHLPRYIRNRFWLLVLYVLVIQLLAMIVLLADSGAPLLVYQAF